MKLLTLLLWPVRFFAGALIRTYDRLVVPTPVVRAPEQQILIDGQTAGLALYHFEACPFCVKVRREIKRLGLTIDSRDVKRNPAFRDELVKGGGQFQVPCLRISAAGQPDQWMYESSDINAYLGQRFGGT